MKERDTQKGSSAAKQSTVRQIRVRPAENVVQLHGALNRQRLPLHITHRDMW